MQERAHWSREEADGRGGIDAIARSPAGLEALSHAIVAAILLGVGSGIALSAPPASPAAPPSKEAGSKAPLWSLAPIGRPPVPRTVAGGWARGPVDAFILARLEAAGRAPAREAPRPELLRRVTLDLTGLLPVPEELDDFLADSRPDAYERVVERLLDSPRYGERWARHWLDLARYAETEGFKSDELRPYAWRYRDYVIESLNADKPYDRFVAEQVAGDELWPGSPEAHVATGFCRHYPDESNARNLLQRRQEILDDITDTVSQVFLGLTYGCARCHDHKYDPITQADYYKLQAFFANVRADDEVPLLPPDRLSEHTARRARWEEATREIRSAMDALYEPRRKAIADDNIAKFPPEIQAAIARPERERTPTERLMWWKAYPYLYPDSAAVIGGLKEADKKRWKELEGELERFARLDPGEPPRGMGITDAGSEAPETHVLAGGVYNAPRDPVEPGFLSALGSSAPVIRTPSAANSPAAQPTTGRRSTLAVWLTSPENPLVARVIVNRLWQHHFGRGLAATPSDLGRLGEPPSHPELLDWLAAELVSSGWSLKALHRLLVTSSAYRQAAGPSGLAGAADKEGWSAGPDPLLGRMQRLRLEGEALRDVALQASGLLDLRAGGESVRPPLPPGMDGYGGWKVSDSLADRCRRSVYVFVKRNLRYPLFEAFDMPDTHESCGRRNRTVTAPQALILLNDPLVIDWARAFAERVARESGAAASRTDAMGGAAATGSVTREEAAISVAFRIAYSREPAPDEREDALTFLVKSGARTPDPAASGGAQPPATKDEEDERLLEALTDLCHVILNSSELMYRN